MYLRNLKRWEFPGSDLLVYQRVIVPKLGCLKFPTRWTKLYPRKLEVTIRLRHWVRVTWTHSPCQKIQRGHTCRITSYTVGISQLGEAPILGGGCFKLLFYFRPYLGKWCNLTNIFFQVGWNQPPTRRDPIPSLRISQDSSGFLGILSVEDLRLGGISLVDTSILGKPPT